MALVKRFEDLTAWKKARALRAEVYALTSKPAFSRDMDLKRQMRRAAVSTELNIAEGFERASKAEFAHFLPVARGSCGEVRAQAWIAMDEGFINADEFEKLRSGAEEVARVVAGLRTSVLPVDPGSAKD